MLKLTKTGIGLLTKQYRSVLRKCLLLNLGLFTATAVLATFSSNIAKAVDIGSYAYSNATGYYNGWSGTAILPSRVDNGGDSVFGSGYISYGYQNITANNTIIGNLEILDRVIGSYTVQASGATGGPSNWALVNKLKGAQQAPYSFGTNRSISENLMMLDYVIGLLQNGTYISSMKTIGDNLKELDTVIGAKIASNGHYIKKSDTNSITANLSALDYALYNYYYTITEADARYAKLSGGNTFTGSQDFMLPIGRIRFNYDSDGAILETYNSEGNQGIHAGYQSNDDAYLSINSHDGLSRVLIFGDTEGGNIRLYNGNNAETSILSSSYFRLNGSSDATGIDFAVNVTTGTTDASHLATTGAVNQLYNYYYTFRVDERDEVTDSASFFQKDFSTLQEVDLQSKNPTHLGAFTKCDEVCPRLSERFASSLSQEQMFKNNASVDAGTSRHCLRQFGDVVADLLKNTAAKNLRIYEFMNEEV